MVSLKACAKINCGLNILRRRSDGYHDIESIFITVDLFDELHIDFSTELDVQCTPNVTTDITSNLAYRAAHALHQTVHEPSVGAKIVLSKSIPTGAGLGGGSSDGAATLRGLQHLWNTQADLHSLALKLGSDVPFFLRGGTCYVTGRGETVVPMSSAFEHAAGPASWYVVLVLPSIHVSTANAYAAIDRKTPYPAQKLDELFLAALDDHSLFAKEFRNDFEDSVFATHSVLPGIKETLYRNGAFYASMSGSGSALFGLFTDRETATAAASAFTEHQTYICRPSTSTSP